MSALIETLPPAPRRVLIIKPSALGDVVTALPVLRGLKRSFPGVRVAWLIATSNVGLLENDADLDEIVHFDRRRLGACWRSPGALAALMGFRKRLRGGRFDWSLDLQGLIRSAIFGKWTAAAIRAGFADAREGARWLYNRPVRTTAEHTVDRNIELARRLGIDARAEDMRLTVAEAGRDFAEAFCRGRGLAGGDYLVCVPPTRWATKQYPPRHWRRVVIALARRMPVVLLGSPAERERQLCRQIAEGTGPAVADLAGQTTIAQMVGLIARSAGVVCCDSAAKFIAPAVGVKAATLIGPTRVERTGPYLLGRAVVAPVPCAGCLRKRCGHATCMESINPELVIEAAVDMIEDGGA